LFRCIAEDCDYEELCVVEGPEDKRRNCEKCLHDTELIGSPVLYRRADLDYRKP
jgi:hypothetical protein